MRLKNHRDLGPKSTGHGVSLRARVLFLAIMSLMACDESVPPVATLTIDAASPQLEFPGYSPVVLRWQVDPGLATDIVGSVVFVHLLDQEGNLFRSFDHALPAGWSPGAVIENPFELFQSALGPPLSAGQYLLTVGLLDPKGQRLPLMTAGDDIGRHEYVVATVEVPSTAPLVEFVFAGDWEPIEVGSDSHILGRRWFGRHGQIVMRGCESGDRVLLRLHLPRSSGAQSEFTLDEGATVPEVQITPAGASETTVVSGSGQHRQQLLLEPGTEGECRLSIASNFVTGYSPVDGMDRVASIELIALKRGNSQR